MLRKIKLEKLGGSTSICVAGASALHHLHWKAQTRCAAAETSDCRMNTRQSHTDGSLFPVYDQALGCKILISRCQIDFN